MRCVFAFRLRSRLWRGWRLRWREQCGSDDFCGRSGLRWQADEFGDATDNKQMQQDRKPQHEKPAPRSTHVGPEGRFRHGASVNERRPNVAVQLRCQSEAGVRRRRLDNVRWICPYSKVAGRALGVRFSIVTGIFAMQLNNLCSVTDRLPTGAD